MGNLREAAMMRVLAVITKAESEVVEYVVLEDSRFPSLDAPGAAASILIDRELGALFGLPGRP
jgi:hypothetical protein